MAKTSGIGALGMLALVGAWIGVGEVTGNGNPVDGVKEIVQEAEDFRGEMDARTELIHELSQEMDGFDLSLDE